MKSISRTTVGVRQFVGTSTVTFLMGHLVIFKPEMCATFRSLSIFRRRVNSVMILDSKDYDVTLIEAFLENHRRPCASHELLPPYIYTCTHDHDCCQTGRDSRTNQWTRLFCTTSLPHNDACYTSSESGTRAPRKGFLNKPHPVPQDVDEHQLKKNG